MSASWPALHDVTPERQAEALHSDFLARVSHEVRTPLTLIRGLADVLRRPAIDGARREAVLDGIIDHAELLWSNSPGVPAFGWWFLPRR